MKTREWESLRNVVETRSCTHTPPVQLLLLVWALWLGPGIVSGLLIRDDLPTTPRTCYAYGS